MRKSVWFSWAALGLLTSVLLAAAAPNPQAIPRPLLAAKTWTAADFERAKSLFCGWESGRKDEVKKVCQDLGFDILHNTATDGGVVCKWKGPLDAKKVEALRQHAGVRYVEPNFRLRATPLLGKADVNQTIKFKPVFTPDNVLDELKRTKKMICAWRPEHGKEAIQTCKKLGFEVVGGMEGRYVVCTWKDDLTQETINKLAADPAVLYIEPDFKVKAGGAEPGKVTITPPPPHVQTPAVVLPNDAFIDQLYGMRNINAPVAWQTVQASPVVVAVCDTGVDYTHEDLADNMWHNPTAGAPDKFGADFIDGTTVDPDTGKVTPGDDPRDRHFHGTHVAGTIGAVGNNGVGVSGVNWRVQIMAVRCLGADGSGDNDSVQHAIKYAVDHGAKIINLSLGGGDGPLQSDLAVIQEARDKGVVLVVAAGNDGKDNGETPNWPSNYTQFVDNIIVVANTDINDELNPSSNFNKELVHLAAPGTDILSTMPMERTPGYDIEEQKIKEETGKDVELPTKYGRLTGTSMSTPHVAGGVALMLGSPKYESLASKPAAEIKKVLFDAVQKVGGLDDKCATGGLLDLKFLADAAPTPPPPPPPTPDPPPPVKVCPNYPPCIIVCPPPYQCPQYHCRMYGH